MSRLVRAAVAASTLLAVPAVPAAAIGPAAPVAAAVGDVVIEPCPNAPRDRCGTIEVPLSWDDPALGEPLTVRFRVFARTDPAAEPETPIVAMEGGPGYGSIGSNAAYRFLFAPLLRSRDLILMDQRGTGGSGAIDCPALQRGEGPYAAAVAACADQLGIAANAYGTAAATDDLAAILDALGVERVVAYGDSYGTYIAQTFAIRHPERVESLVLDAAYDDRYDPFTRDAAAALARSFDTMCDRAGTCRGILEDIGRAARKLDRQPLVGTGVDSRGHAYRVRLTGPTFAQLLYDATYKFTIYRDIPAALEAWERGDEAPLLRLVAEDLVGFGGGGNPRYWSEGAYAAIACHDYPTIWDRSVSIGERRAQLQAAIDALAPDAFAPFPLGTYLRMPYEVQIVRGCLRWPALGPGDAPMPTLGPHPDLPVLVLNGEFDVTTPLVNGMDAAAAWPNATFVALANEIHVTALYDYERCASRIVRRFVRTHDTGDTSCAGETPEISVVEGFPGRVAEAPEADILGEMDRSAPRDRRVAWAVVQTVADAFNRWWNELFGGTGAGLRGGTYTIHGPFYSFERPLVISFDEARFVRDVAVSGTVTWRRRAAVAVGRLRVDEPGSSGAVVIRFDTDRHGDLTTIIGELGGRHVELVTERAWTS
jgi:pimeloyl-ACP methyl ester carboxylesterase